MSIEKKRRDVKFLQKPSPTGRKNVIQMSDETTIGYSMVRLENKLDTITDVKKGLLMMSHEVIVNKSRASEYEDSPDEVIAPIYHYKTSAMFYGGKYAYVGYGNDYLFTNQLFIVKPQIASKGKSEKSVVQSDPAVIIDTKQPWNENTELIYSVCGKRVQLEEELAITSGGAVSPAEASFDKILDVWVKTNTNFETNALQFWAYYGTLVDYPDATEYDKQFLRTHGTSEGGSVGLARLSNGTPLEVDDDGIVSSRSGTSYITLQFDDSNDHRAFIEPEVDTIGVTNYKDKQGLTLTGEVQIPSEISSIRNDDSYQYREMEYFGSKKYQSMTESSTQLNDHLKNEFERLYEKALDKKLNK